MAFLVMDPGLTAMLAVGLATYAGYGLQLSPWGIKALAIVTIVIIAGKAIVDHGGMIVGIQGDALLAAFGASLAKDVKVEHIDHADDAVWAAQDMLEAVAELNGRWHEDGFGELATSGLQIRIGVHSGPVVLGNVGSEERVEFTLIGDTVNIAARVEELNKRFDTSLLLTAQTRERLADRALYDRLTDLGQHNVRGRQDAVHVYTQPGLKPPARPPA
jgi:adenylate cyclase